MAANGIAPAGPNAVDLAHWVGYTIAPGVASHPLGTDSIGRDLLARSLYGLRASLVIAVFAALIAAVIGALVAKLANEVSWFDDRAALPATGLRPFVALSRSLPPCCWK